MKKTKPPKPKRDKPPKPEEITLAGFGKMLEQIVHAPPPSKEK
jgi:hypothetical protein